VNKVNKICIYWDCGWCYHPAMNQPYGCPGSDKCVKKEYRKRKVKEGV